LSSIDLIGLGKSFNAVTAVKDLTLSVRDKEFIALLGPSGCGKTTTMNMIAGIENPSTGEIRFNGIDISRIAPNRRNIGFVFQNYAIFTHLSVFENLAFALRVRRLARREIDRRVREIAALMQLSDRLDWPSARLSVNEMQKLAIGRSAIAEPAIFLLDEPLSNVDAAFRVFMRAELKRIQRTLQQTMVYVTHDQTEAMSLADRIAVLDRGLLQQFDTPAAVYNRPRNTFVARFMGSPAMNLLEGNLAGLNGAMVFEAGAKGRLRLDLAEAERLVSAGAKQRVLLGIRPEDIVLAGPAGAGEGLILPINFIEPIGPRTILHLGDSAAELKVVTGKRAPYRIGEAVKLVMPAGQRRYFDPASGLALETGALEAGAQRSGQHGQA
jgi:multiple sugar transport system ATP-binding protein